MADSKCTIVSRCFEPFWNKFKSMTTVSLEVKRKGETNISPWDFLGQMVHEGFAGNIPERLLKKFSGYWFYIAKAVTYSTFLGCYIGFFATSFLDGVDQTYVSLDNNAGKCETVVKPLTGSFLASAAGAWEGSAAFKYTDAIYEFRFNDLQVDGAKFETLISQEFSPFAIGQITAQQDIATNLLVWMSYQKNLFMDDGKVQRMAFLAGPSNIFNRRTKTAGVYAGSLVTGSEPALCLSQYTSFDVSAAIMSITLPTFGNCSLIGKLFSSVVQVDGEVIRAQIALNPFTTVASINRNVTSVDQLEKLQEETAFEIQGQQLTVSAFFDPKFPNSDTFFCVDLTGVRTVDSMKDLCCIDAGGLLLLPVLAHADEHCASCNPAVGVRGNASIPCDYLGLLAFYVFIPELVGDYTAQTTAFIDLYAHVTSTQLQAAASRMYRTGDGKRLEQLCPNCAFLWMYAGDDGNSISPYRRPMPQGLHCVDSVSSAHFDMLAQHPPTALTEKYFVCRSTLTNNLLNSVGISFSNTSIFAVVFLAIFLSLLYYVTKRLEGKKDTFRTRVLGAMFLNRLSNRIHNSSSQQSGTERPRHKESTIMTITTQMNDCSMVSVEQEQEQSGVVTFDV